MTLPAQLFHFVGREPELEEIHNLLDGPTCRLLTLVGPGGSGKTRLALEIAQQRREKYEDGSCFVPLQAVVSLDLLVSSIIDAMGHNLYGQEDPVTQLLNYLSDKHALLITDNFEHLLEHSHLLAAILSEAPEITLLVTSRETLNLREEWLFPVGGMAFPHDDDANFADFSAVQLFVAHARRVRRDFVVEQEQHHIIEICRAVDGMPLGIELAASWLRLLPCSEIASEIQHNLDFLATNLRDIPERHRSMRAVFEQSWKLLNETERNVFKQLSIFGSSFGRDAAVEVAGATLPVLATLVGKSLVQTTANGRYQMHQLLRQYGSEKLQEKPEEVAVAGARHCHYFATFAHQRHLPILGSRQREALQEIAVEIENIQAAWRYAVDNILIADIENLVSTFYLFCDLQSRYREVIDLSEYALNQLTQLPASKEKDQLISMLLSYLGWGHIRLGRYDDSKEAFTQSLRLLQQSNSIPTPGFGTSPLAGLSLLHGILGKYEVAIEYGEQARHQSEAGGDELNFQIALYSLASTTLAQGEYGKASAYAQDALAITRRMQHHWMAAYVLIILGDVARSQGDYEQARQHYLESYTFKEALDDPEGMAAALNHLGEIALLQDDFEEATHLYRRSLDIYQQLHDRGGLAAALRGAAKAAVGMDLRQKAYQYFSQALQTATAIQYTPLLLTILADVGEIMLEVGRPERATELLAVVLQHSASEHQTREQARATLNRIGASAMTGDADAQADRGIDLAPVIDSLQTELTSFAATDQYPSSASRNHTTREEQDLIDPLTEREIEVLHLLAKGMTNKAVAAELTLVIGTVKAHNHNIFSKLGVSNRVQAIARARELGILD